MQEHTEGGLMLANVTDTQPPGGACVTFTNEEGECGVVGVDGELV